MKIYENHAYWFVEIIRSDDTRFLASKDVPIAHFYRAKQARDFLKELKKHGIKRGRIFKADLVISTP